MNRNTITTVATVVVAILVLLEAAVTQYGNYLTIVERHQPVCEPEVQYEVLVLPEELPYEYEETEEAESPYEADL